MLNFRALAFLLLTAALAQGQTARATLTGLVTDPTGAVIANVVVNALHVDTGTTLTGTTSQTGNYTIPQLPVGRYEVTVEQSGFKTFRRTGLTLLATQVLRLDIELEVGATTESITVTAESSLLKTESGVLTHNILPDNFKSLPLMPAGGFLVRDPFALGNAVPGVIQNFVATRVNGLGQNTVQYRLDGEVLGQLSFAGITTRTQPSPDAIEEVAIQTSNISAEFGSASGAVFNISIKSGTNQFHGTAYDYVTNEVFNAYDPGNHQRSRVRKHDYGFNIGGPVKIPWVYDGENKTFFFFNWEQFRDSQIQTSFLIPTVPTAEYRSGNFSGLFDATAGANLRLNAAGNVPAHDYVDPLGNNIKLGTIFDPRTTRQVVCNTAISGDCGGNGNVLNYRDPFPGQQIPASMFDSVATTVLNKYVPLPNQGATLINNFFVPVPTSRITSSPAIKGDQNLGSRGRFSFVYNQNKTVSAVQTAGNLAEGFPFPITGNSGTYEAGPAYRINLDYTVRPTINYHLGLGYSLFEFETRPVINEYSAVQDIGLSGATAERNFPRFNLGGQTTPANGGLNSLGTNGQTGNFERRPSMTHTVTWVHGNHTFKGGFDWRQDMLPNFSFSGANGIYNFTGNGITWNPSLLNLTGFQGNSNVGFTFANYLMGSVRSASLSQPVLHRRQKRQYGIFIQDTWRARRNLTIDYGLRWDYGTYAREDYGRLGALSLTEPNTSASGRPGGLIYEATCNCNFAQNYPFALGPRLGVAYTLNPKTVLRGGFGVAYGSIGAVSGVAANTANTAAVQDGEESFKLAGGMPSSLQPMWPVYDSGQGLAVGAVGFAPGLIDPNAGRPDRTFQWNISLQREITRDLVVEASYVGNRNVWASTGGFNDFNAVSEQTLAKYNLTVGNLADATLLNQQLQLANASTLAAKGISMPYSNFPRNFTVLQSLKPFPQYSNAISPVGPRGKSWYDALQLTLTKRFSHGLQANVNYTFSKNLQHTSSFDVFNNVNGKDIVTANPPQVLRFSFEYQVPKPAESIPVLSNSVVSWVVRDWALSGAMFYQTGSYLGRPSAGAVNGINRWLGRGPGSAQLKQDADGNYMSPWAVNWTDLDGVVHPEPLDINCHCFDPEKTVVLNPDAWTTVPDAVWAAQTQQLPFFRASRRPTENMNLARNFRMGPEGRYNLQVRVEFYNVFNRKFLPSPTLGNFNTAPGLAPDGSGRYISGFGTFNNLRTPGRFNPTRTGQFIARFTF